MRAPRLVTRALVTSFLTVAVVLVAVFGVLSLQVREQARQSVADSLAAGQQVFTRVEARRRNEMRAAVATLAENPTLKAALDVWPAERRTADRIKLFATVQREADKIADRAAADVLAVADSRGRIVASSGRLAAAWRQGATIGRREQTELSDRVATVGDGAYHVVSVPLHLNDAMIGSLELGTALDGGYARELADLSRGHAAIVSNGKVLGTTLDGATASDLAALGDGATSQARIMTLNGESWAIQPLSRLGDATLVALASVDDATGNQTAAALQSLAWVALGAMFLAAIGSVWLARTLTRPIDELSTSIAKMIAAGPAHQPLPLSGSSRELDQLTFTFNALMASVVSAEDETEATYLGAVRALAAALDARDPYTAGHSERVSRFSVAMGEELGLDAQSIETLRLGALLHDIGKIGVPDEVLRKPGILSAAEFESIKTHPTAGARILRSIAFLAPHIPIVELHHERPDGLGYPYGLRGADIPLFARIVHVADAFDAMTSARAYRSGRIPVEAIAELRQGIGTDFDGPSVEALVAALPKLVTGSEPFDPVVFQWAPHRARSA